MSDTAHEQGKDARLVTMGEFSNDPEVIIDQANTDDQPVIVTRHGRFLFLIEPIAELGVELSKSEQ